MSQDENESRQLLQRAWRKRGRNQPLTEEEYEAIRQYDKAHDEDTTRMRIPNDLWERIGRAAKSRGTSPTHYVRHLLRADLDRKLAPREQLDDLQRKFKGEIGDALRVVDDTNRRLAVALRVRDDSHRELTEALDMMESTANRFDDFCNLLGAPEARDIDLAFLRPRNEVKAKANDGEVPW